MSRIYDNWERLVAAVLRREELWQLCHDHSTNPSICSESSDFSSSWSSPPVGNLTSRNSEVLSDAASHIWALWEKRYKPGVHITLAALPDGTRFVKRVRFSRMGFEEQHQAVIWWFKNREKVYKRYNAWGGNARIRRPSVVIFSSTPLIDHQDEKEEKETLLAPAAESDPENLDPCSSDEHESVKTEASKISGNEDKLPQAVKGSTKASDLPENEKIALQQLKHLVQEALNRHEFSSSSPKEEIKPVAKDEVNETTEEPANADDSAKTLKFIDETSVATEEMPQEVFIWGVKLLEDEKTDAVLLKFLRARDFEVKDAFTMIKNTIQWRNEFGIDELLEEDFDSELERVVFMHGYSKEGHPVCYNVYGELQDKELYQKMFSDEEKRQKFLRWRIQFLEKCIRKLDFSPGGISTIVQVNDLQNSPGPGKRELRQVTSQALQLFQDNYPEFVAKQVFINVPRWYLAFNKIISPLLTSSTKSKFAFAGPSLSMVTLFRYISAEQIPPQYRGLSKDGDFGTADSVTEIVVKPSGRHIEEFPVTQACLVSWEVRVVGWEVMYAAEFVPSSEYGYTVIVDRMRRIGSTQEQIISSSCKVSEPGKLVLIITNLTS